jgi:hypothetical protein
MLRVKHGAVRDGNGYVMGRRRKRFFFEKKKQKTFGPAGLGTTSPQPPVSKSFLLLFFKKEALFLSSFAPSVWLWNESRGCRPSPA